VQRIVCRVKKSNYQNYSVPTSQQS